MIPSVLLINPVNNYQYTIDATVFKDCRSTKAVADALLIHYSSKAVTDAISSMVGKEWGNEHRMTLLEHSYPNVKLNLKFIFPGHEQITSRNLI